MSRPAAPGSSVVETASGPVRGCRDGRGWAFLGIPYAAPPVGPDRLREPRPPRAWSRPREAIEFGPTAPHAGPSPRFPLLFPDVKISGEAFLNLNVWTPDPEAAGLPVMVWIHGGAFLYGSAANPEYHGAAFARDGVVFVSLNYRLGAEGFLLTEDGSANLGLLDQVAALEWVRDNVAAFGGDPGKVTVAGHSAGGMSVTCLLGMPAAAGLFRGAIAMAGAGHHVLPAHLGRLVAQRLAAGLGVRPTAAALRSVPAERLAEASQALARGVAESDDPGAWGQLALDLMPFEPTVDGVVLPQPPLEAIAAGSARDIALLVGCNTEEARFFFSDREAPAIDETALADLASTYGLGPAAIEVYRRARPAGSAGDLAAAILSDWAYRVPAIRLAEAQIGAGGAAWMYLWDWRSSAGDGQLGAAHGVEWPFVFDCLSLPDSRHRVGAHPPQKVADTTHSAWVRFVTEADPGWGRYRLDARETGVISAETAIVTDPWAAERRLWDGLR